MKEELVPSAHIQQYFGEYGLQIKVANANDLPNLIPVMFAIYEELAPRLVPWYQKNPSAFEEEFFGPEGQDSEKRVFFIIKDIHSGRIVGSGGLVQANPADSPTTGELTDIYLSKEYRNKGLGRSLVSELIEKAMALGFHNLYLTTRVEFVAAISLYKSFGFKQVPNKKYPESKNSLAFNLRL